MRSYPISINEICNRYRLLYTGAISDILDKHGLRSQNLPNTISQMTGNIKIAGPAFTGWGEEVVDGTENDADLRVKMLDLMEPDTVTIWQTNGHDKAAHWGEIMSTACLQRGCTGAVIEGGVRDMDFIEALNFPVYASFKHPAASIGRWSIREYQVPIKIGITTICPGDFVIGDIDGVVIVPSEIVYDVLLEAEKVKTNEEKMRAFLKAGGTVKEMFETFGSF